jgi:hypothetical protein
MPNCRRDTSEEGAYVVPTLGTQPASIFETEARGPTVKSAVRPPAVAPGFARNRVSI